MGKPGNFFFTSLADKGKFLAAGMQRSLINAKNFYPW
jgi:hypothetical protein